MTVAPGFAPTLGTLDVLGQIPGPIILTDPGPTARTRRPSADRGRSSTMSRPPAAPGGTTARPADRATTRRRCASGPGRGSPSVAVASQRAAAPAGDRPRQPGPRSLAVAGAAGPRSTLQVH